MTSRSDIGAQVKTMKKLISTITGVLLLLTSASAESRLLLSAGANLIRPADAVYRSVYGGQAIYPEVAVSVRILRGFCLTGSFGEFAKDGTTPNLGLKTRAKQSYFTMGVGYLHRVSSLICVEASAGVAGLRFSEDALDSQVKGQKMGLMGEGGALYMDEDGQFFMGLKLGFLSATVNDFAPDIGGPQSVRLGGFKVSVSFGIQLFANR
jgi:hypothetical protein